MVRLSANEEFELERRRLNELIAENNNCNSSQIFDLQLGNIATNIAGEEIVLGPSHVPLQKMDIFWLTEMSGRIDVFISKNYASSAKDVWEVLKNIYTELDMKWGVYCSGKH